MNKSINEMDTLPASIKIGKFGLPDLSDPVFEDEDDEPTVRMQNPLFSRQVIVEAEETEVEVVEGNKYPGVGMLICLGSGLAFWGVVAYLLMH